MDALGTHSVRERYDSSDRTEYEYARWGSSPVARAGYILTKEAIERSVLPRLKGVKEYLELGAGPGTWTKLNAAAMPEASIHLVDISHEMLESAKKNLADIPNIVTYTQKDFLEFVSEKPYDVFFSSRAIEYFPDKRPVLHTIAKALKKGGEAYLITKMPHYTRMKMLGKDPGAFHKGQISPEALSEFAREVGLELIKVQPIFLVFPGLRVPLLHLLLTKALRMFPWNPVTASVAESYLMSFKRI